MGNASPVFADRNGITGSIACSKVAAGLPKVLISALRAGHATETGSEMHALVGGDMIMYQIAVIRQQRISLYLYPHIREPGGKLRKLILHPTVLKLCTDILGIMEPAGSLVNILGIIELVALTGSDCKTAG